MTRVPPIVLPAVALLGLIVAIAGLAMDWPEVAPVAFFVLIFCTILTTMQYWIATAEPYVPPVAEAVSPAAASVDAENHTAAIYDSDQTSVAPIVDEPSAVADKATPVTESAEATVIPHGAEESPQRPS